MKQHFMNLFLRYWLIVLLYMGGIFYLSSRSSFPIDAPEWMFYADKIVHACIFGLLSVLVLRAWVMADWHGMSWSSVFVAILFTSVYGVSDEIHQQYVPGRHPSFNDLIADAIGATVFCTIFYLIKKPSVPTQEEAESD